MKLRAHQRPKKNKVTETNQSEQVYKKLSKQFYT